MTFPIAKCRQQSHLDKQIHILYAINSALPKSIQLQMSSLLTNDYINRALDTPEDRIFAYDPTATNRPSVALSHKK